MRYPTEVITRNLANPDEAPMRRIIDHDNHSDRVWFGKHSFWSLRNNYSVTAAPMQPGDELTVATHHNRPARVQP